MTTNLKTSAEIFDDMKQMNHSAPQPVALPSAFKKVPAKETATLGGPPVPIGPPTPVGASCFPAGSRVLLADGSTKNIEDIVVGDILATVDGKSAPCVKLFITNLGSRDMLEFDDHSLMWSEEHLFWTRDESGKEWWWSYNTDTWKAEADLGIIVGLKDNNSIRTGDVFEFATVNGWESKTVKLTDKKYGPDTVLYEPMTTGYPAIVNGYVVTAGTDEWGCDYTQIKWDGLVKTSQKELV